VFVNTFVTAAMSLVVSCEVPPAGPMIAVAKPPPAGPTDVTSTDS